MSETTDIDDLDDYPIGVASIDEAMRISQELLPPQLGRFWRADDYGELEAEIIEVPE